MCQRRIEGACTTNCPLFAQLRAIDIIVGPLRLVMEEHEGVHLGLEGELQRIEVGRMPPAAMVCSVYSPASRIEALIHG